MLIRHAGRRRVQGGAVSIGRAGRGRTECRHWTEGGAWRGQNNRDHTACPDTRRRVDHAAAMSGQDHVHVAAPSIADILNSGVILGTKEVSYAFGSSRPYVGCWPGEHG